MKLRLVAAATMVALFAGPRPARADATIFLGATTSPTNRPVRGFAFGVSLLVFGFEFEYANTQEDEIMLAPSLRTGMGNVFAQTPFGVFQFYGTVGGGMYRERLRGEQETGVGVNTGGGVKVSLAGPLRARIDYRVFTLRGTPLHSKVQRVYAGLNLMF